MVLGDTIVVTIFSHFLRSSWMILSYGNHTGAVWALPVYHCRTWCTLGVDPWTMFHPVTPGVSYWGFLLHYTSDATGPLVMHAVGSTLGLLLHLYEVSLDTLVEYGSGVQILARWPFGMWIDAFPDQGDHDVLRLVHIGWLAHWIDSYGEFRGWYCIQWTPNILWLSWRRVFCECLRVYKSLLLLFSPSSMLLVM